MKSTISILFILVFLTSCSNHNDCNNTFDFIATTDTIPILNFDIKKHYDLTRKDIARLYNEDLCERCSWVEFKIPFDIESKKGFLKIMTDFDSPYCNKCPIPMRLRHYYRIETNKENQLFIEDEISNVDSLQSNIEKYLAGIGKDETGPESFSQVNYLIRWGEGANQIFLDTVLTKIYKAHLKSVENLVRTSNRDFCLLNKKRAYRSKKQVSFAYRI